MIKSKRVVVMLDSVEVEQLEAMAWKERRSVSNMASVIVSRVLADSFKVKQDSSQVSPTQSETPAPKRPISLLEAFPPEKAAVPDAAPAMQKALTEKKP